MDKYYDEFATNCKGCGWLIQGAFPDGMPYLSCMWNGTIMHTQSNVECKDARTPEYVAKYLRELEGKDKKRTTKRK